MRQMTPWGASLATLTRSISVGKLSHLGKLIEAPGDGNQRTVIAEAVQGSPVDPLTKGLAGADDPSLLPDGIDGFFSGAVHGGTVQKRRQNVKSADFF